MPPRRMMSPPDRQATQAAAQALGLPLSDTQAERLLDYLRLLQHWNATYNLTAVRDPAAMWLQHGLDCMSAVPSVRRHLATQPGPQRRRILDVGSGGGLPGLVWALLMPEVEVSCVDAVAKKAAFIRQAAAQLGLSTVQVHHARVQALDAGPFDLITSRAFASLPDFITLTRPLLSPTGAWVAMKGKPPHDELADLDGAGLVFHVEPLSVPGLAAERCLVWLRPKNCSAS